MSEEANVKLSLEGGGLSYANSITILQAAEIVRIASLKPGELLERSASAPSPSTRQQKNSVAEISLPEALKLGNPSTSAETIAVIATWIMDTESAEAVTRADVAARYRDARLSPPANLPRDFSQAIRKGFLAPVRGSNDLFYVTQTGRALLNGKEKS